MITQGAISYIWKIVCIYLEKKSVGMDDSLQDVTWRNALVTLNNKRQMMNKYEILTSSYQVLSRFSFLAVYCWCYGWAPGFPCVVLFLWESADVPFDRPASSNESVSLHWS